MNDIKYKITFSTDWHCGSGLAAGADVDALVIKDKERLPYVPGKTMKGLVREAVELLAQVDSKNRIEEKEIVKAFGSLDDKEKNEQGCMFFGNAELAKQEREAIASHHAQRFLYRTIASTAIQENGIAQEHSLRKMEVAVPCEVIGSIKDIPDTLLTPIENGLKMIKRLGQNRNRGLGRCNISIIDRQKKEE